MGSQDLSSEAMLALLRREYTRPIVVATVFTLIGELMLLLFYGVYLSNEGSLIYKIIWTLGFCGLGMGFTLGAAIDLFLVNRIPDSKAIWATAAISTVGLGIACNWLCTNLDRHFGYFGGAENLALHILPSFFAAAVGGWLIGWLLFSVRGKSVLESVGL